MSAGAKKVEKLCQICLNDNVAEMEIGGPEMAPLNLYQARMPHLTLCVEQLPGFVKRLR